MDNIEYLKELSKEIDIDISNQQVKQFEVVYRELVEWNEKINLTTITNEKDVVLKHFIDSLVPSKYIENNCMIIDVGTGAGFPGIPLKIINDSINLTLVDTVGKKVNYINNLISLLNVNKAQAIHARAEDLANDKIYREKYDIVISRALANMTTLVEYLIPFAKIGGKVICMKGPNIDEEIDNSKRAINILGGKIREVIPYMIRNMETTYNLVVIDKIKNTPECYPRKAGIPSKKPLA